MRIVMQQSFKYIYIYIYIAFLFPCVARCCYGGGTGRHIDPLMAFLLPSLAFRLRLQLHYSASTETLQHNQHYGAHACAENGSAPLKIKKIERGKQKRGWVKLMPTANTTQRPLRLSLYIYIYLYMYLYTCTLTHVHTPPQTLSHIHAHRRERERKSKKCHRHNEHPSTEYQDKTKEITKKKN